MQKIYLSPSEQPANKYAYGNTNEKEQCRRIAAAAEKALKRCGFDVITADAASLAARCDQANAWGAALYVPIHTNAFNGVVSGTRMFCYSMSGNGYKACKAIFDALAPLTIGTSESITARPELYEVKNPLAPTAYIEVDFHDVPSVAKWIIEHTDEIGEAICKGICNYYGVAYKPAAGNTAEVDSLKKQVTELQAENNRLREKIAAAQKALQ